MFRSKDEHNWKWVRSGQFFDHFPSNALFQTVIIWITVRRCMVFNSSLRPIVVFSLAFSRHKDEIFISREVYIVVTLWVITKEKEPVDGKRSYQKLRKAYIYLVNICISEIKFRKNQFKQWKLLNGYRSITEKRVIKLSPQWKKLVIAYDVTVDVTRRILVKTSPQKINWHTHI